jgi:hypothetical protein
MYREHIDAIPDMKIKKKLTHILHERRTPEEFKEKPGTEIERLLFAVKQPSLLLPRPGSQCRCPGN